MNKFILSILALFLFGALIISGFVLFRSNQRIPDGEAGLPAETLRDEIERAVNIEDWNEMAALEFTFAFNQNHHFMDIKRGFVEVQFKQDADTFLVQYDEKGNARASMNHIQLSGDDLGYAFKKAKSFHNNDLFWLNPIAFLRDNTRIKKIGNQALLVTFLNKNNDTYLIVTDKNKRPTHWKMWTEQISLKGMESSFENWQQIKNSKALVSLEHKNDFQKIVFTDVIGYNAYPPPGQKDRFLNFKGGSSRITGD